VIETLESRIACRNANDSTLTVEDCGRSRIGVFAPFRLHALFSARKAHMFKLLAARERWQKFLLGATAAISTFTVSAAILPAAAADNYSSTVSFLSKSFLNGKALEGTSAGTFEYGFTLDAMMQLKAGGKTLAQQLPAVNFMLGTRSQPLGTASNGYLFNKDADLTLNVGRAGKFLFTSEVVNVPNNSIRNDVFKKLSARINSQTGEISGTASGAIDYAWVALGLNSYQEFTLANKVVQKMLTLQNTDGGFGEVDPLISTPDSTGLALQAINLKQDFGADAQDKKRSDAEKKAIAYLVSTSVEKNHWDAYGEASINSTAYAAMGLKAAGKKIAAYSLWLKSQLAPKGGFMTSWSDGAGDKFATAQAITPLLGKSYLDLLP
jgi:hypothetical protein